jgi:hypothetical protein
MKKLLVKLLAGALSLALLVSGLVACGSSSTNWTPPTIKGEGTIVGGFIGQTDDNIYFINGMATSTADNTFGAPVKGSLMVQDKNDLSKAPQVVVPKLFASTDYQAGVYIYGDRVYYGTPSTDKNNAGNIANDKMTFASTKLDGTDTKSYFTVDALSVNFRIVENDGTVYIVYYDSAKTALYYYNTTNGENEEIIKTDAKAEGKNAVSLAEYKLLDNDAVEQGFAVAYTVTIYNEEYYEDKAKEDGYSRATKKYNEVYVFGVYDGELQSKKITTGETDSVTYAFHYLDGVNAYLKATDVDDTNDVTNYVYDITYDITKVNDEDKDKNKKDVYNMDIINDANLILNDELGRVIALDSSGVVRIRYAFEDDKAKQEIIAISKNISEIIKYDGKYLYFYDQGSSLCRVQAGNEDAPEVFVSEDMVSRAWYDPEFMTVNGVNYVFYLDSSTKGASYVKYANLDKTYKKEVEENVFETFDYLAKDTNDDGEDDRFYLDGQEFLAKRLDSDVAAFVISTINDIISDISDTGSLKLVEDKDGKLTLDSVVKAKELYDVQTDSVKASVPEATKKILDNYVEAIEWANVYNTLKDAKKLEMLDDTAYGNLKTAYEDVKEEIEKFKKTSNYATIRDLLGNDLNAYYQKCKAEFELEEE